MATGAPKARRPYRSLPGCPRRSDDGGVVGEAQDSAPLRALIEIAKAITTERELDTLLHLILEKRRFITGADAGSVCGEVIGVIQLINKKRDPDKKLLSPGDVDGQVIHSMKEAKISSSRSPRRRASRSRTPSCTTRFNG
jgi:hypothetical protein